MLAYAANTRRAAGRAGSPKALALILAGHAALIAAVLTAKMDVVGPVIDQIPKLIPVKPLPPPPPEPTVEPQPAKPITQQTFIDRTPPKVEMDQATSLELDNGPTIAELGALIGSGTATIPEPPRHSPVKLGPRLVTAGDALKPTYPNDKLRNQEEATLKLKLTIDARGRVISVDPVGAVDPSFLAAARRHILKSWRYKPATEDGVAVSTSTVISLAFRLEDA